MDVPLLLVFLRHLLLACHMDWHRPPAPFLPGHHLRLFADQHHPVPRLPARLPSQGYLEMLLRFSAPLRETRPGFCLPIMRQACRPYPVRALWHYHLCEVSHASPGTAVGPIFWQTESRVAAGER